MLKRNTDQHTKNQIIDIIVFNVENTHRASSFISLKIGK